MYAVIKAGGKQLKVKAGDVIEVELIHGGHEEEVTFTPLLVVDDDGTTHVGKDLGKALVRAKLVGEKKGAKIKVFKYKSKSGYSRRQGHRQTYTLAEVLDINLGRRVAAKKEAKPEPAPAAEPTEPAEAPAAAAVEELEAGAGAEALVDQAAAESSEEPDQGGDESAEGPQEAAEDPDQPAGP